MADRFEYVLLPAYPFPRPITYSSSTCENPPLHNRQATQMRAVFPPLSTHQSAVRHPSLEGPRRNNKRILHAKRATCRQTPSLDAVAAYANTLLTMLRTRRVLVATILATALCADRLAVAAPTLPPQVIGVARQIAGRLAASLRGVVPAVRFASAIRTSRPAAPDRQVLVCDAGLIHLHESQPFQFRLPPPALA